MSDFRGKILALFTLSTAGLMAALFTAPNYAEASTALPPATWSPPTPPALPAPVPVARPTPPPRPECPVHVVRMRVTACAPDDPKDVAYYARYGYEGGVYGVAAYTREYPRGTLMRIPGYLERSYPDHFWPVDSAGGSVIRRSARRGIDHIDVKFRSTASAKKWGSRWLDVEVIYEDEYEAWQQAAAAWDAAYARIRSPTTAR